MKYLLESNLVGIAYAELSSELASMTTLDKGKWDARTYDQVSRLVQYRWGIQVLKWRKWRGDEIVMDAGCGSGLLTKQCSERESVRC